MPSDIIKENASVVDSSVTEWEHDKQNLDDTRTLSCKENEDTCHSVPEEQGYSCDEVGTSSAVKRDKLCNTRYFIIKSLNYQNIQLSIEKGIWATQLMNEPILEEAFHNSRRVILIFSVNMSGFFQGYAQMMSSVGWKRDNVWSQGGGNNPWGRSFKVKWLRLHDLPFQKTLHLKNPLNQDKPVKISRDCQELPQDIGEALCKLLDGESDVGGELAGDNLLPKRPCLESSCSEQYEECCVLPIHLTLPRTPMLYPSLFYRHQADNSSFHVTHQRPSGTFLHENLPVTRVASKVTWSKHSGISESITGTRVGQDSSQFDAWGLSAERSPLTCTMTEDDILDMTYEEYLEAHGRRNKQIYQHVGRSSWRTQESSMSKDHGDDLYSCGQSKKRSHTQSK